METLPLSEVKARLSEIADEVSRTHERIRITKNGHEYVVLLSVDDLASIEETLELLSDPAELKATLQAQQEMDAGDYVTEGEVEALLATRLRGLGVET